MMQTKKMPIWVQIGLLGTRSRKMAMATFSLSFFMAMILVPEAFMSGRYILLAFIPMPIWYWFSINWADENGDHWR